MGDRVSLLGVNEAWEEDGITNEENRSIVSDNVPISIFSVELDGKTSRIPETKDNFNFIIVEYLYKCNEI
jgi:hypothetical protein